MRGPLGLAAPEAWSSCSENFIGKTTWDKNTSTHLKNISENENLPQISGKNKKYLKPPPSIVMAHGCQRYQFPDWVDQPSIVNDAKATLNHYSLYWCKIIHLNPFDIMCQRSEIRNEWLPMSTVMYSPQNHSRDMGPMRMLIHMYNKQTQWTIKDPWVLNRWKSIERNSKILLNRTSEASFQPFGNIQCWSILRGSISCELYLLRGLCLWRLASKKSSRELQDSTTHSLRYFQSEMPFVGIISSVYLEAFWTTSTSNFLRIIIKFNLIIYSYPSLQNEMSITSHLTESPIITTKSRHPKHAAMGP